MSHEVESNHIGGGGRGDSCLDSHFPNTALGTVKEIIDRSKQKLEDSLPIQSTPINQKRDLSH